jgi:hypothetical protein
VNVGIYIREKRVEEGECLYLLERWGEREREREREQKDNVSRQRVGRSRKRTGRSFYWGMRSVELFLCRQAF